MRPADSCTPFSQACQISGDKNLRSKIVLSIQYTRRLLSPSPEIPIEIERPASVRARCPSAVNKQHRCLLSVSHRDQPCLHVEHIQPFASLGRELCGCADIGETPRCRRLVTVSLLSG